MEGLFDDEKTIVDDIQDIERDALADKLRDMRTRRKYGDVDNIDFAAVSNFDVEDPKLIEHMDNARKQLKAFTAAQSQPLSDEEIATKQVAIKQHIADLVRMTSDCQSNLRLAIDDAGLHASNIRKIADNIQPHGYPDIGDKSMCLKLLSEKINALSLSMEEISIELRKSYSAALVAARNYEQYIDARK